MDIVQDTDRRLVLRDRSANPSFSLLWGLMFGGIPTLMVLAILWNTGIESLQCRRVSADQVDCILEKSAMMGRQQLPTLPLPLVDRAEYRYTEGSGDEDCRVIHRHDFDLMFVDGSRQTLFESFVQTNCTVGDRRWIEANVARFNQFVQSQTGTFEIVRDSRFSLMTFMVIPFLGIFMVIGFGSIVLTPWRISLHLDRETQEITQWHTTLFRIRHRDVPFHDVRAVRYTIDEDSDEDVFYTAAIDFKSDAAPIVLGRESGGTGEALLATAKRIAHFLGVELEQVDVRKSTQRTRKMLQIQAIDLDDQAQELLDYHTKMYGQRHEFAIVTATKNNFPNVDLTFYDRAQRELETLGFQALANIEDLTISRTSMPQNRTFVRVMLAPDHRAIAAIYMMAEPSLIKILGWLGLVPRARVIELESELEDGTFLVTNNLEGIYTSSEFPGIDRQKYSPKVSIEAIVHAHQQRLDAVAWERPAREVATLYDAIEMQHRMQDRKNAHKQNIGYVTPDDIRRVARPDQAEAAEALGQAIVKRQLNDPTQHDDLS